MNQGFDSTYLKQLGASTQASATGYAPPKLAPPDADNVQLSVARSRDAVGDLVSRVGRLADRLCGAQPSNDLVAGNPAAFGVFPEIKAACDHIGGAVADAHAFLDRIEAQLPATPLR